MDLLKKNKKIVVLILVMIVAVGVIMVVYYRNKSSDVGGFYGNSDVLNFDYEYDDGNAGKSNNFDDGKPDNFDEEENIENVNQDEDSHNDKNGLIYVHIIGEINNAGVVALKNGERIVDAIEKAGGVTELADLSKVNLAFVLSDGQMIRIPSVNDVQNNTNEEQYIKSDSGSNVILDNGGSMHNTENVTAKVNINTASQTELETLRGIGPSLAARIIEYRKECGKFKNINELRNVSGIGDTKFEQIKNNITV